MSRPTDGAILPSPEVLALAALGIALSAAAWGLLVARKCAGRSLLPYQPRRQVPWDGFDALLLLALFIYGPLVILRTAAFLSEPIAATLYVAPDPAKTTDHPIVVLLRHNASLPVIALCLFSAVVVAPIVEEFVFRVVFQGWLERVEHRVLRFAPAVLRGILPIALPSSLFAFLHLRVAAPERSPEHILLILAATCLLHPLIAVAAFVWLRFHAAAKPLDLGWDRTTFWGDVRLGLILFFAMMPLLYAFQFGITRILPKAINADPFTLLFFAAALGTIYYRTHRIVPIITTHAALNAISMLVFILTVPGSG